MSVHGDIPEHGTVRATHSVAHGEWYYEVEVVELPDYSNISIGWAQLLGNSGVVSELNQVGCLQRVTRCPLDGRRFPTAGSLRTARSGTKRRARTMQRRASKSEMSSVCGGPDPNILNKLVQAASSPSQTWSTATTLVTPRRQSASCFHGPSRLTRSWRSSKATCSSSTTQKQTWATT